MRRLPITRRVERTADRVEIVHPALAEAATTEEPIAIDARGGAGGGGEEEEETRPPRHRRRMACSQ